MHVAVMAEHMQRAARFLAVRGAFVNVFSTSDPRGYHTTGLRRILKHVHVVL